MTFLGFLQVHAHYFPESVWIVTAVISGIGFLWGLNKISGGGLI